MEIYIIGTMLKKTKTENLQSDLDALQDYLAHKRMVKINTKKSTHIHDAFGTIIDNLPRVINLAILACD